MGATSDGYGPGIDPDYTNRKERVWRQVSLWGCVCILPHTLIQTARHCYPNEDEWFQQDQLQAPRRTSNLALSLLRLGLIIITMDPECVLSISLPTLLILTRSKLDGQSWTKVVAICSFESANHSSILCMVSLCSDNRFTTFRHIFHDFREELR